MYQTFLPLKKEMKLIPQIVVTEKTPPLLFLLSAVHQQYQYLSMSIGRYLYQDTKACKEYLCFCKFGPRFFADRTYAVHVNAFRS